VEILISLLNLCNRWLPLNRKERYYTATVLPSIICAENFAHFGRFLKLLELEDAGFDVARDSVNIQFSTQYSLADSIFDAETKDRFREFPVAYDTPDLMILIDGSLPMLIAIEAKMFSAVSKAYLLFQMHRQRDLILASIVNKWPRLGIVQVALLPLTLKNDFRPLQGMQVITGEDVYHTYKEIPSAAYFNDMLWTAISQFDRLRAKERIFGENAQDFLSGEDIVNGFQQERFLFQTMGRQKGITGQQLIGDISRGEWRKRLYEVRRTSDLPNRNWFRISDFVDLVKDR
jgi:hypothetical protein